MIKKWEQRVICMNFKKAVIIFYITGLVMAAAVPAALYGNFQSRIAEWEQVREAEGEHRKSEREREGERRESEGERKESEETNREKEWEFYLTWSDFALLAGCAAAGAVLGIWYWLLVMIWAYRKAYRMGVNGGLAVLAALFFNLAAVVVLYLYGMLRGTCTVCGRVRYGDGKFCDRCGNPLKKECPRCGQEVDASSAYCGSCGKKLDENEETEK